MRQQLQMFGWRQFVIERHQHAAAVKNGVRGNQPLRLIGHDDRGAVAGIELGILQRARQRLGNIFEVGVGQAVSSRDSGPTRSDRLHWASGRAHRAEPRPDSCIGRDSSIQERMKTENRTETENWVSLIPKSDTGSASVHNRD